MKSKEFEAWFSRNVGKGGKRPSYDPFNKSFKGSERNPAAEEYASKNVEEYHLDNFNSGCTLVKIHKNLVTA